MPCGGDTQLLCEVSGTVQHGDLLTTAHCVNQTRAFLWAVFLAAITASRVRHFQAVNNQFD